ncbi:MAG: N-acetylmuramoyl-L-alanine amidase [Bacteroidales bacterium]|nr:N-acetylmuramoyl-L-alanine amidase [Bacteroidales bacterium]
MIDPGHGGKDPGASGKHSREKDITLAVALKFGQDIREHMKGVKVVFTRTTDTFIPLFERAKIASENHADLFVSIHCNSNPSHTPYGAETYVMGLSKTKENMDVAEKENKAILYEDNRSKKYDGFDLNSPQSYINLSLFQNAYLKQSLQFAHDVEQELRAEAGMDPRGVYQAGFLVLWQTTMPSVLVELGFLSNPKDEAYLISKKGQSKLAYGLYLAFKKYKENFEKENAVVTKTASVPASPPMTDTSKHVTQKSVEYRVQFISSSHKYNDPEKHFSKVKAVSFYSHKGIYRYTSGHFKDLGEADALQRYLRKNGYKGAFVVAFYNGERISTVKAKKLNETLHQK